MLVDISHLMNRKLVAITGMHEHSNQIEFVTDSGDRFRMYSDQYRSNVELVDVYGDWQDLLHSEIVVAEARTQKGPANYASATWTFYELATQKGSITLRWLGTSNGYYSETVNVEHVESEPTYQVDQILDGWFGEPLEYAEDEALKRRALYEPLRAIERELQQLRAGLETI
jgi:hypothetical protein